MSTPTLIEALIPELPNHYRGKVRENYDLADGRRVIITTDRLSAFDRHICAVPEKGRLLTQITRFGFDNTWEICPNHAIEYPDPNVIVAHRLRMLPVEIVVRDYLAGTTETSLLSRYKAGDRHIYGIEFPDGLRDNEALASTVITPTTKSSDRDQPLSAPDVIARGLMTADQWDEVEDRAMLLFARGRRIAADAGLILADTKYEFGLNQDDRIVLGDEIHTPDSSRYWLEETYETAFRAGTAPPSFDKDVIRGWITEQCDPYVDQIPEIPPELITLTTRAYVNAYERLTGQTFEAINTDAACQLIPGDGQPILDRIRHNLMRVGIM